MVKPPKLTKKQARTLALLVFAALLVAFGLYCARFIERTSFEIDGQRYFALFDDAMISMQYARNLAAGHGLVWNAGGERVEGFSNPLWVGLMAFWHLFSWPEYQVSLAVQISGAVFLLANLFVVKKLAKEFLDSYLAILLTLGLTAFYFHLNNWSLQGMEVGPLALILSSASLLAVRSLKARRFSPWPYALLTLGTFVRVDIAVPLAGLTAFMAWKDVSHRRQHLSWGLGLLAGAMLMQSLARKLYYGDWLPNTYYLKVLGVSLWDRVQRGFVVFWAFVWQSGWFLILMPILLVLIWPDAPSLLLAALFVGQAAYSIYVGGDAWEHKGGANRFIAIAMPLLFVLFMRTLEKIRAALIAGRKGAWWPLASQAVLALFVLASLFSFNVINENDPTAKWTLLKRPPFVAGTERYVRLGLLIKEITTPQARIAVATAGNIIYFAEREGIDMLGKSDRVIAHSQPHENSGSLSNVDEIFRPGHNKWDYQHSIVDLHPDIVAQIWGSSKEMDPYLTAGGFEYFLLDGYPLYIRVDSENIDWDAVNAHLEATE